MAGGRGPGQLSVCTPRRSEASGKSALPDPLVADVQHLEPWGNIFLRLSSYFMILCFGRRANTAPAEFLSLGWNATLLLPTKELLVPVFKAVPTLGADSVSPRVPFCPLSEPRPLKALWAQFPCCLSCFCFPSQPPGWSWGFRRFSSSGCCGPHPHP